MVSLAPPIMPAAHMSVSSPTLHTASSRPSTIKRRSTLKRSFEDSSEMNIPSSPSKRSRVTFDSDVEFVSADDEDEIEPLLVREEIRRAIQRHLLGDNDTYERVKSIFSADPRKDSAPSALAVRVHLSSLLAHVDRLKGCQGLVKAAIYTEWVGRDERFVNLHTKFLGNIAAAQAGYTEMVMRSLVELLGKQKTRRLPHCKRVRQSTIHKRTLFAIQHVLSKVPGASSHLAQEIQRNILYDYSSPQERIIYIKNFMDLIHYAPELNAAILSMITAETVKLDVSVQVDLEDEEDDLGEEILQDVSSSQTLVATSSQPLMKSDEQLDDEEDDGSTTEDSDLEGEDDLDPTELRRRRVRANVERVDLIMNLLFDHYDQLVLSSSLEVRDNAIEQLITHFTNLILPTYRSRHTQFLIFHFAQTSPVLIDRFVSSLITILADKGQPAVLRRSAAAYLAGFVGRGALVSTDVVRDCFALLCDELTIRRREYESNCRGPDLKKYSNFYAVTQAVLYIFCFRWRDLATASTDMDDDSDDEEEVEQYHFPDSIRDALTSAIHSPLNPLRVCTPVIVEQFAKITHALHFLYIYTKIEANKNVRLSSSRLNIADLTLSQPERDLSWVGENGVMEGYFPYDPYQLPMSKSWVTNDYVEWKGIPGEDVEDGDSEEDEEDDEQMGEIEDDTATEEDA